MIILCLPVDILHNTMIKTKKDDKNKNWVEILRMDYIDGGWRYCEYSITAIQRQ